MARPNLNPEQADAVGTLGDNVIVAPPGSGKTTVLIQKILRLVQDGTPPDEIGAVTFTRAAAQEIRDRMEKAAGKKKARALVVGTFHSVAGEQLNKIGWRLKIIRPAQRMKLMRELREHFGRRFTLDDMERMIEACKAQVRPLESGVGEAYEVAREYQKRLRSLAAFDFADLIRESVRGMRKGDVDPLPLSQLLIDEFQDADPIQYEWAMIHAEHGAAITAVGDDDQSIYGWRHAMGYHGMAGLQESLGAKLLRLERNYRSRPEILDRASTVILNNKTRIEKKIEAHREPPPKSDGDSPGVQLFACGSAKEEAEVMASLANDSSLPLTVLSRTNAYLNTIEQILSLRGIPYRRHNGRSIYATGPVSALLSLLDFIARNDRALLTAIGKVVGFNLRNWREYADEKGYPKDPAYFVQHVTKQQPDPDPPTQMARFWELARRVHDWRALQETEPALAIYGAKTWLAGQVADGAAEEMMGEISDALSGLTGTLDERIAFLRDAYLGHRDMPEEDIKVHLMTIHRSKGCEFPWVWIPGLNEDHLPSMNSDAEEERRLLYVGMTRAEERLSLSYTRDRNASDFIDDLKNAGIAKYKVYLDHEPQENDAGAAQEADRAHHPAPASGV